MSARKYPMVKVKEAKLYEQDGVFVLMCFAGHIETRPVKRRRLGRQSVPDPWPKKFRCVRCAGGSS